MTIRGRTLALRLGLSLVFVAIFAMEAYAVSSGAAASFDDVMRSGVHLRASAPLTMLSRVLSRLGSVAVLSTLFVLAMTVFLLLRRRGSAFALALAMAGAVALEIALKYAFHRTRPEPFFATAPESFSFPSGHALFSACFFLATAALLAPRVAGAARRAALWMCAGGLVAAIGLSRIYLGVHYPSDVIGGYLVAAAWLCAVWATGPFLPADTRCA
jgi:undecaprenyl-diphosphatase